jgi:hypothetical protein
MLQKVLKFYYIRASMAYKQENRAASLPGRPFRIELDHEQRDLDSVPR